MSLARGKAHVQASHPVGVYVAEAQLPCPGVVDQPFLGVCKRGKGILNLGKPGS